MNGILNPFLWASNIISKKDKTAGLMPDWMLQKNPDYLKIPFGNKSQKQALNVLND